MGPKDITKHSWWDDSCIGLLFFHFDRRRPGNHIKWLALSGNLQTSHHFFQTVKTCQNFNWSSFLRTRKRKGDGTLFLSGSTLPALYGRRETTVRQTKATLRLQAVSTEAPTTAETKHGAKDFFLHPQINDSPRSANQVKLILCIVSVSFFTVAGLSCRFACQTPGLVDGTSLCKFKVSAVWELPQKTSVTVLGFWMDLYQTVDGSSLGLASIPVGCRKFLGSLAVRNP